MKVPLLATLALLFLGSAPPPAPLTDEIDAIIRQSSTESAFWGAYVKDLTTGEVLYRRNAEHPFMPASNMKLFTSATALATLGPDHRYETKLLFDGTVRGTTLRGDLIIEGSGDPTFGSIEVRGPDPLKQWAQRLARMGVTAIEGRLIGDDDTFDNRSYSEGWDIDYVTSQASRLLGVSISGLSYNDNLIRIRIRSGAPGEPPTVTTTPPGYLTIRNWATTQSRRRGRALDIRRTLGHERVTITGSVPSYYAATFFTPVVNPTLFTLHSFKHFLREAGINVEDLKVADIDSFENEPDVEDARLLFVHLSPPLAEILPILNKESNNFYADQVFRSFGWGGSAEGAANRVEALLERAGANVEAISIHDGSGLSRKDYVTPRATVLLLAYMYDHPASEAFLRSLPEGGERESTLQYRMSGVPVRAKTGSLAFARALSGYVTTADGHEVAFSLYANNYVAPSYRILQTFDRIVRTIASTRVG